MSKQTKDIIIAALAIGAIVLAIYYTIVGRAPKVDLDTYTVLGVVTAEETAKLVGNKGQVLVMVRDTGDDKNPSVEAELRAFQQTLKKQKGIHVITERVPVTPMLMMATGGGVAPEQLLKALETHNQLGALVLFFGFPDIGEGELAVIKKSGAKIIVVSSMRPGYKQLLEQQVIHAAIVPREGAAPADAPAVRTVRERFDQENLILTPATAGQLP